MSYLGIDIERAPAVASTLRATAAALEPIVDLVRCAEVLSGLPVGVTLLLDDIGADLALAARAVELVAHRTQAFRIDLPAPMTSSRLRPSHGSSGTPWNLVHQDASHNTYAVPGAVTELYRDGLRAFELDIHRGAPTDFRPRLGLFNPFEVIFDHADHGGGRPDDWRVYHHSADQNSEYRFLGDGLAAIADLDSDEPITVFIDNKDPFGGTHTPALLDARLRADLGDRLYTPADLLARAPGATTLSQAVARSGWPTTHEMRGRVVVVVTDEVPPAHRVDASFFVATAPTFSTSSGGRVVHERVANVVFYNADARRIGADEITAVQAGGAVIRTYNNPRCHSPSAVSVNYRAADIEPGPDPCGLHQVE